MARGYDVWVLASNTIYKGVPFNVVTDWAQQGRLGGADKVRPAGSDGDWTPVGDDAMLADYLFVKKTATQTVAEPSIAMAAPAMDQPWEKLRDDDDDDVDMIPLIDISLVLLIFFMMTAAVSSLSPVDVPQMKHGYEMTISADSLTVIIDKRASGDAGYSLRIGEKSAESADADLDTLALLLVRLDARLNEVVTSSGGAPEVRFACHRELPSERVHDLVKELETRKKAGKLGSYRAEVNEKK